MELTQGYALKDGKVGIQDIRNWQDPDLLGFVSSITSSTGARQLREVSHPDFVDHPLKTVADACSITSSRVSGTEVVAGLRKRYVT